MTSMRQFQLINLFIGLTFLSPLANANNAVFTVEGYAANSQGVGLTESITVVASIRSPAPNSCLLWAEQKVVSAQDGEFVLEIGNSSQRISGAAGGAAASFRDVFMNNPGLVIGSASCASGNSYTPTASDRRTIHLSVTSPSAGSFALAPMELSSVPWAMQANEIGGYGISNLMKVSGVGSPAVFSPNEVQNIKDLLMPSLGTSNQILGVKNDNSGVEYKSITAGANVTITHSAGGIEIAATGGGGGSGTVTNVSVGGGPLSVSSPTTTPVLSITQAGSGQPGYLTAADWNMFNNKQPAGAYITGITSSDVITALGFTPSNYSTSVVGGGNPGPLTLGTNDGSSLNLETNNTPVMTLTSGGSVGVGTTSPQANFEVFLSATDTVLTNTRGIRMFNNSAVNGNFNNIKFSALNNTGSNQHDGGALGVQYTDHVSASFTGEMYFSTALNGTLSEKMRISGGGNVGIGTSAPNAKLDVNGGIRATEICDEAGANCKDISTGWGGGSGTVTNVSIGSGPLSVSSPTTTPVLSITQAGSGQPGYLTAADWNTFNSKQPAGAYLTSIAASSIGTAEVSNSTLAPVDLNFAGSMAVNTGVVVRDGTQFYSKACAGNEVMIWSVANGWSCNPVVLSESDPKVSTSTSNALAKWNGSALVDSGVSDNGGNIGIGTAAPAYKLDVVGGAARASSFISNYFKATDGDSNFVQIRSPTNVTADYDLILPPAIGTIGQVLRLNGSGELEWANPSMDIYSVGGLINNAAITLYVNSTSTDSNCLGLTAAVSAAPNCPFETLAKAMKKLPLTISMPIVIQMNSGTLETESIVIDRNFIGNGSLTVDGSSNYMINSNFASTTPSVIVSSRGFVSGAPVVKLKNLTLQGHNAKTGIMNFGSLALESVTIQTAPRSISSDNGFLQLLRVINLLDVKESGIQMSGGNLEVGDGDGGYFDDTNITAIDPGATFSARAISCFGCSIRITNNSNIDINLPSSIVGNVTGVTLSQGAHLEVETSGSYGLTVNGSTSAALRLMEIDASKVYLQSGEINLLESSTEVVSMMGGSSIHVQPNTMFNVDGQSRAVVMSQGSIINVHGNAVFKADQAGGSQSVFTLSGGSEFNFLGNTSSSSLNLWGPSDYSGTGFKLSKGSHVKISASGTPTYTSNYLTTGSTTFASANSGSTLEINGTNTSAFTNAKFFLDRTSTASSNVTFAKETICAPGLSPFGPPGKKVCAISGSGGTNFADSSMFCTSGTHLCRRDEMRRICNQIAGSGVDYWLNEPDDGTNAKTIDCAGGTSPTFTNISVNSTAPIKYCCAD